MPSITLFPAAAEAIGEPLWSAPQNIETSNDVRSTKSIDAGITTGVLRAYQFNASMPSTAIILGLEVHVERSCINAESIVDASLRIATDANTPIGDDKADLYTPWPINDAIKTYGANNDLWGTTLTLAIVNSADFSVLLTARNITGVIRIPRVDAISITLHYRDQLPNANLRWMIGAFQAARLPTSTPQEFSAFLDSMATNLEDNPYIESIWLSFHWRNLEPTAGVYDWDKMDAEIQTIADWGRTYKIVVVPGVYSPDWLYDLPGMEQFDTLGSNPYRPTYQQPLRIPLPWNEVYLERWLILLTALAQHMTEESLLDACHSITVVPWAFQSCEHYLPRSPEDMARWQAYPGYQQRFITTHAWVMGEYSRLFPDINLCLESPLKIIPRHPDMVRTCLNNACANYGSRLHLQLDYLSGKENWAVKPPSNLDFLLDLKSRYPTITIGMQSLAFMTLPPTRIMDRQGSINQTVANFQLCGAEYFEIWYDNGRNINLCHNLYNLLNGLSPPGGDNENDTDNGEDPGEDDSALDLPLPQYSGDPTGDIRSILLPTQPIQIDWARDGAGLAADGGLETAVLLSLFSDRLALPEEVPADADRRGWWADTYAVQGDLIGSKLWLIYREKALQANVNRARDYAAEALQWLIDDGVASAVTVTAGWIDRTSRALTEIKTSNSEVDMLGLQIEIQRPANPPARYRFDLFWGIA